jgi:hypothetical protein
MFQRIRKVCCFTGLAALLVALFLALASAGPVAVQALPLQTPTQPSHESLTPSPPITPVPETTTPPPSPNDGSKSGPLPSPTPTPIPLLPPTGGPSDGSPVVWLPCLLALLSLVEISGLVLRRRSP